MYVTRAALAINKREVASFICAGVILGRKIFARNVLSTAFVLIDPESVKITVKSSVSFLRFWDLQE